MLECCGKFYKTVSFMCDAPEGFLAQRLDYLRYCGHCKRAVLQVTRINLNHEVSRFRRTDALARDLFERMRSSIIFQIVEPYNYVNQRGKRFLRYNKFGVVDKCFSNFSSLLDVGESLDLPKKRIYLKKDNDAKQLQP